MSGFLKAMRPTLVLPFGLVLYYFCPTCGFVVSDSEIEEAKRDQVFLCTSCRRAKDCGLTRLEG